MTTTQTDGLDSETVKEVCKESTRKPMGFLDLPESIIMDILSSINDIYTIRSIFAVPEVTAAMKPYLHHHIQDCFIPRLEVTSSNSFFGCLAGKTSEQRELPNLGTTLDPEFVTSYVLEEGHIHFFDLDCGGKFGGQYNVIHDNIRKVIENNSVSEDGGKLRVSSLVFVAVQGYDAEKYGRTRLPISRGELPDGVVAGLVHKRHKPDVPFVITSEDNLASRETQFREWQWQWQTACFPNFSQPYELFGSVRNICVSQESPKNRGVGQYHENFQYREYEPFRFRGGMGKLSFLNVVGGEGLRRLLSCSQQLLDSTRDIVVNQRNNDDFCTNTPRWKATDEDSISGWSFDNVLGSVELRAFFSIKDINVTASSVTTTLAMYGCSIEPLPEKSLTLSLHPCATRFPNTNTSVIQYITITGIHHLTMEYSSTLPHLSDFIADDKLKSLTIIGGNVSFEEVPSTTLQNYGFLIWQVEELTVSCTAFPLLLAVPEGSLCNIKKLTVLPYAAPANINLSSSKSYANESKLELVQTIDLQNFCGERLDFPALEKLEVMVEGSSSNLSFLMECISAAHLQELEWSSSGEMYLKQLCYLLETYRSLETLSVQGVRSESNYMDHQPEAQEVIHQPSFDLQKLVTQVRPQPEVESTLFHLCPNLKNTIIISE